MRKQARGEYRVADAGGGNHKNVFLHSAGLGEQAAFASAVLACFFSFALGVIFVISPASHYSVMLNLIQHPALKMDSDSVAGMTSERGERDGRLSPEAQRAKGEVVEIKYIAYLRLKGFGRRNLC